MGGEKTVKTVVQGVYRLRELPERIFRIQTVL